MEYGPQGRILWMKRFPYQLHRRFSRWVNHVHCNVDITFTDEQAKLISSIFASKEIGSDPGTSSPDIVVVSTNFWDLGRWSRYQPEVLEVTDSGRKLFQHELDNWQKHFVTLLLQIQVSTVGLAQHSNVHRKLTHCFHLCRTL